MTDKMMRKIRGYSDKEISYALSLLEKDRKMLAIKEELGGGYYYRCPLLTCNKVIKSEFDFCPYCGSHLIFVDDSYTR